MNENSRTRRCARPSKRPRTTPSNNNNSAKAPTKPKEPLSPALQTTKPTPTKPSTFVEGGRRSKTDPAQQTKPVQAKHYTKKETKKEKKVWKKLGISTEQIVAEKGDNEYISLKDGMGYDGWGFWHAKRFIRLSKDESHDLDVIVGTHFSIPMTRYAAERDKKTGELPVLEKFQMSGADLVKVFERIA